MDLHPILDEPGELLNMNVNMCYLVNAGGDSPSARVGHTGLCVVEEDDRACAYFIGGANPNGSFAEMHMLDFKEWMWNSIPAQDFVGRYEHAAYSSGNKIYVFGGANISGNLKDVQRWDIDKKQWNSIDVRGDEIDARTHHTSPVIQDKLLIFGGGHNGADPVEDDAVHVFDASTNTWTSPATEGKAPSPRQGHLMVAIGNKVYLHGGMAGNVFFDDLHVFDFESSTWTRADPLEGQPSARAAHGGIACDRRMIIFGGMNDTGALNDLFTLDTETMQWTEMAFEVAPPTPRLDFAMCLVQIKAADLKESSDEPKENVENNSMSESPSSNADLEGTSNELVSFILIHGGMNTDGDIYNDCFITKI